MRSNPKPLQVYRHFKGNIYQVIDIAQHTETGEKLVIYRPLYQEGKTYARPLAMFLSEVDKKKYPAAEQKYRFELYNPDSGVTEDDTATRTQRDSSADSDTTLSDNEPDQSINPYLETFLDAASYEEKLDKFLLMRGKVDEKVLSDVAMSLDLELTSDSVDEMYAEILKCLKTMEKYECNRLRR